MKVCIDPGHYGDWNISPCDKNYNEAHTMWKLHQMLKEELEKNRIKVITTKKTESENPGLYDRGALSKGCDLFLSLHSNATTGGKNETVDYPVAYCTVTKKADEIGKKLAKVVQELIPTMQAARIQNELNSSGTDYYGVLRGATAVGTPGLLLEHSFHTNSRAVNWMLDDNNLRKLAKEEAKVIAKHYGIKTNGWIKDENGWKYYLDGERCVTNDWFKDKDKWYWFNASGYMITNNWYQDNGKWYYLGPDGAMKVNEWICIENELYRLGEDGAMETRDITLTSSQKGNYEIVN